jgi:hypothetical protein
MVEIPGRGAVTLERPPGANGGWSDIGVLHAHQRCTDIAPLACTAKNAAKISAAVEIPPACGKPAHHWVIRTGGLVSEPLIEAYPGWHRRLVRCVTTRLDRTTHTPRILSAHITEEIVTLEQSRRDYAARSPPREPLLQAPNREEEMRAPETSSRRGLRSGPGKWSASGSRASTSDGRPSGTGPRMWSRGFK